MTNSESGMAKKNIVVRFLAFSLAAIMMLGAFAVVPVLSVESEPEAEQSQSAQNNSEIVYDEDVLSITVDGEERTELEIYENEKVTIKAEGVLAAKYQWQILHPERSGLWVDIYEETKETLDVSLALTSNMEQEDGKTYLRCLAYEAEGAYVTDVLEVATLEGTKPIDAPEIPKLETGKVDYNLVQEDGDGTGSEFVTIQIDYIRYAYVKKLDGSIVKEEVGSAFTSYVAMLKAGGVLDAENGIVENPTIVGFDSFLYKGEDANGDPILEKCDGVVVSREPKYADEYYEVQYHPALVDYEVHYYFQNIYDDLYVEDSTLQAMIPAEGYTGQHPDVAYVEKEIDGFTALYYEPETIAADGSTVFNVYYERDYYLMEFDCNGGYGADTLYVRQGTYISVPNPVRMGYEFAGWNKGEVQYDANGNPLKDSEGRVVIEYEQDFDPANPEAFTPATLPKTMPIGNTCYRAEWKYVNTTYTVVYWLQTADKTEYLGNRQVPAMSNSVVSGSDDINNDGVYICGEVEHTHDTCTKTCTLSDHVHVVGCYSVNNIDGGNVSFRLNSTPVSATTTIDTLNNSTPNENGIVTITTTTTNWWQTTTNYAQYYKINDNWYQIIIGNTTTSTTNYADSIEVVLTCTQHVHNDKCYGCGLKIHTHTDDCHGDSEYCEFVKADQNVIVSGDGSTVVNVYYKYKTYTIRFIYARTNTSGGDVYLASSTGCGQYNNDHNENIDHNGTSNGNGHSNVSWSYSISSLPTITDTYYNNSTNSGYFTEGIYRYYYISLTAQFGADIEAIWPDASIGQGKKGNTTYDFGSWGAECASGYRKYNSEHANIVGPYPVMSEEMIVDPNNPIAQTMVAWWGNSGDDVLPHAYHIYYEVLPGKEYDVEKDGKYYKLNRTQVFTAAHNTNTRVDPFYYNGFTIIESQKNGYPDSDKFYNENCSVDSTSANHDYCNSFFYNRNTHDLAFHNYNDASVAPESQTVKFGETLNTYKPLNNPEYPIGIEPGAYEFKGWFTTPECYPSTEVKWDTMTMPDGNLTVYANWEPIKRNVYFHYLYSDMDNDDDGIDENVYWYTKDSEGNQFPKKYPIVVDHGALLGTTYSLTPTRPKYTFIGWFYMDEDNKKRFAPDSMEVRSDLHLFAEWQSGIDTQYKVDYVISGDADTDNDGFIDINGKEYKVGEHIAESSAGHSTAGKTKTFTAKAGAQLYDTFKDLPLFPKVNSHSILMSEPDENGSFAANEFTFEYVYDEEVYYTVKYLNKLDNSSIYPEETTTSKNAIVTVKFKPKEGYIPEKFYIQKVLAADGDSKTTIEENVIIFYYIPDTDHGVYTIRHFKEKLDGEYELVQSEIGTANKDTEHTITIDPNRHSGFKYVGAEVYSYNIDGTQDSLKKYAPGQLEIKEIVTQGGLEINIYYDRIPYPYAIKFMQYGTTTLLGYGLLNEDGEIIKNTDGTPKIFTLDEVTAAANKQDFGKTISYEAPDTIVDGDMTYLLRAEDDGAKTLEIRKEADDAAYDALSANNLIFWYDVKVTPIEYHIVCTVPDLGGLNALTINGETPTNTKAIMGSTATPGTGFTFVGWFEDENCTVPIKTTHPDWLETLSDEISVKLKPKQFKENPTDPNGTNHYYALFEPQYGSLIVTKLRGDNNTPVEPNESFLFHIKGKNNNNKHIDMVITITNAGSKTINKIPIGDYEVTEMGDWSYTFNSPREEDPDVVQEATVEQGKTAKATFYRHDIFSDWLTGEDIDVPENNNKND